MTDVTIHLGESILQHGKYSDRVYLMKLSPSDFPGIIGELYRLGIENGYGKIFAKIPAWAKKEFEANGYQCEAIVPNFFKGQEDGCFMAYYFDRERARQKDREKAKEVLERAKAVLPQEGKDLNAGFECAVLTPSDIGEMVAIYKEVFPTYPFPIHDPAFIEETMSDHVIYFGIRENGTLTAVSSAEMDMENRYVEMTDFATLPSHRGKGLASFLLGEMEKEMVKKDMITAYTIARSLSLGMNMTFAKYGYHYQGTLVNNTNIGGSIESMNIWYKPL
jgi:putative beta-lysine N-acetyltransferase